MYCYCFALDSRVYNRLLSLADEDGFQRSRFIDPPSRLSLDIACGTCKPPPKPPGMTTLQCQLIVCHYYWFYVVHLAFVQDTAGIFCDPLALNIWGAGKRKELNLFQKQAILFSYNRKFQLIQGPPGMAIMCAYIPVVFTLSCYSNFKLNFKLVEWVWW